MRNDWRNCINYEVSSRIIAKSMLRKLAKRIISHMAYH